MKKLLILVSLLALAPEAKAMTKTFYIKFKGQSDSEALDKVDDAIVGIKNGKYRYRHEPIRVYFERFGCERTKPKNIKIKAVTVKKGYRINRRGDLETFRQATVQLDHKKCSNRD